MHRTYDKGRIRGSDGRTSADMRKCEHLNHIHIVFFAEIVFDIGDDSF